MDASKFIALVLGIALAGVLRQWWAGFVRREEAKPIELVEVDGVMTPKRSRLERVRAVFNVFGWLWITTMIALLAALAYFGPAD